jgi:hypothetical protein
MNAAPTFNAPPGMANINFSAPVIRLGAGLPLKPQGFGGPNQGSGGEQPRTRPGLGADQNSNRMNQASQSTFVVYPAPSKEDILKTIHVGNLGNAPNTAIERALRSIGALKRFLRVTNTNNKPSTCGFAEWEDWESFAVAAQVLQNIELRIPKKEKAEKGSDERPETENYEIKISVDEASEEELGKYREATNFNEEAFQSSLEAAENRLKETLERIANPNSNDGDVTMRDIEDGEGLSGDVVTIQLTGDDELLDIPAEMREVVLTEIAAFRERSTQRDLERLKREEEIEAMERARSGGRVNRLASPTPNGTPLGPRDRNTLNAPAGPKGQSGSQIPKDLKNGVSFQGAGWANSELTYYSKEEEETDASDSEVENRRNASTKEKEEKAYLDQERRWQNREKSRAAAIDRERDRDDQDDVRLERERDIMAKRLREYDDDAEAARKSDEYYADHSLWSRKRQAFRAREIEADNRDRQTEGREQLKEREKEESARGLADQFLEQQGEILAQQSGPTHEPQRFKLSLGAAAQRAQAAAQPRRTVAEVEGLLEDEEDTNKATKRTLIPIKFDSSVEAQSMTEEERDQAVRQLAADIPNEKEGLWSWDVKWDFLDESVIADKLKPFVEKKIMEYLGVQEQMLVDVVEEHLRLHKSASDLVSELEMVCICSYLPLMI